MIRAPPPMGRQVTGYLFSIFAVADDSIGCNLGLDGRLWGLFLNNRPGDFLSSRGLLGG